MGDGGRRGKIDYCLKSYSYGKIWCTSRKNAFFYNLLILLNIKKGVHQVMKLNKNKDLDNFGDHPLEISESNPWGAPILLSNLLKLINKKWTVLEGLT